MNQSETPKPAKRIKYSKNFYSGITKEYKNHIKKLNNDKANNRDIV